MADSEEPRDGDEVRWPVLPIVDTHLRFTGLLESLRGPNEDDDDQRLQSVRRAVETLSTARGFFGALEESDSVPPVAPPVANHTLRQLEDRLRRLRVVADAVEAAGSLRSSFAEEIDRAVAQIDDLLEQFLREMKSVVVGSSIPQLADAALPIIEQYEDRLETRRLVTQTEAARDAAVSALRTTRRAAGATGETQLADHFGSFAKRERRTADRLRVSCIAAIFGIAAMAGVLLLRKAGTPATTEELAKLSLTIPIAALATYLGREASRHRAVAQWASELEVQLLTVDAYTEPLSDGLREGIRAELGRRVFSTHSLRDATADDNAPSALADAAGLVEKAADLMRSTASRQPGGTG